MRLIFCIVFITTAFASMCFASDVKKYSHEDLTGYDNKPMADVSKSISQANNKKERRDAQLWCNRAKASESAIEKEKRHIKEIDEDILRLQKETEMQSKKFKPNAHKINTLQKKRQKAVKKLQKAEEDLAALHEDARIKDIPAGWLRCQTLW